MIKQNINNDGFSLSIELLKEIQITINKLKYCDFAGYGTQGAKSLKHKDQSLYYIDSVSYGLTPSMKTVFAGKIPSYGIVNFILRLALGAWPGDHRDWIKIESWTDSLAEIIKGGNRQ